MDPRYWQITDGLDREHFRRRNTVGRAVLTLIDDTGVAQIMQFEGYQTEIRDGMQRLGEFGFHSVPLAGASAVTLHQGGDRGFNTTVGIEDGRYRPRGGKPGEAGLYGVDGADAEGKNGKLWWAFRALAGKVAQMLGKTLIIGDGDTVTITATGQTVNITGQSGDVKVNGISLVNHTHPDPQGGATGKPQ